MKIWQNKAFRVLIIIVGIIAILWIGAVMAIKSVAEKKVEEELAKSLDMPGINVNISSIKKSFTLEYGNIKDPNSEFLKAEIKGVKPNFSDFKQSTADEATFQMRMSENRLEKLLYDKETNLACKDGLLIITEPSVGSIYGKLLLSQDKKSLYFKVESIKSEQFIDKDMLEKAVNPLAPIPNGLNIDKFEFSDGFYQISGTGDVNLLMK